MSKRKNGTLRAAKQLGINPYGWGNGKGRTMRNLRKRRKQDGESEDDCGVRDPEVDAERGLCDGVLLSGWTARKLF